ncbi:hypothetical protein E4U17_000920 [Claviceps sp. LM77 group G4]|nr:hypothetical protein E4U17_000920 [Claviceps sp. LM77 group G4]KAG6078929.1 hypothetical protein E4U33_000520 [Claviceps sp. LM78 group G4]KAG6079158.1 hypothetical protein E4U16_001214 [Claviceps sp. LM84 group G4]
MFSAVGRAAIGRAATRRVLLPSRLAASPSLATQFFCGPARTLSIAARLLSPAKAAVDDDGAPVTKKKRKSAAKKEPAVKKETAAKKQAKEEAKEAKKQQDATKQKAIGKIGALGELYQELQEAALNKPQDLKRLPNSAFQVYVAECKAAGSATELTKSWTTFHDLPSEKKEHYIAIAEQNKAANRKMKEEWALSLPVEVIYLANLARKRIAQLDSVPGEKKRALSILDPRQPIGLPTTVGTYVQHRYADLKYDHNAGPDTMRAIVSEWKDLPQEQKDELHELNKEERAKQSAKLAEIKAKALQWIIDERKQWPHLVADLFDKKSKSQS